MQLYANGHIIYRQWVDIFFDFFTESVAQDIL